jgi:GNAT superfamily N-acetyltransferase
MDTSSAVAMHRYMAIGGSLLERDGWIASSNPLVPLRYWQSVSVWNGSAFLQRYKEIIQFFRSTSRLNEFTIFVNPDAYSVELKVELEALAVPSGKKILHWRMHPSRAERGPVGQLTLRRVVNGDQFVNRWLSTILIGNEVPKSVQRTMADFYTLVLSRGGVGYLSLIGGEPVAAAVAIATTDVVALFDGCTLPNVRRRGIGTALLYDVLQEWAGTGRPIVLQSEERLRAWYPRVGGELLSAWDKWHASW